MVNDIVLRLANIYPTVAMYFSQNCDQSVAETLFQFVFHIHAQLNIQLRFQVTVLKIVPGVSSRSKLLAKNIFLAAQARPRH
jgi:hypothetical protein